MNRVKNTADNPRPEWLFGGNPNAIEAQEAQGQKELESSSQLPRKVNHPRDADIKDMYAKMGIEIISESNGDDLFYDTKLPEGWQLKATDHSMWNNLINAEGKIVATIFYKAAFYDRDAFINFEE